ncbi:MAG: hypothetical protein VXW15_02250, partial [Bdellovibrionota bacterium]|nr:hypothetical protein [Bdellovibrionota bacterium]
MSEALNGRRKSFFGGVHMRVYLFITILILFISKQVYAVTPKLKDVKLKGFYHRICDPQKFFMMHGRSARKFSKMMIKQSPRW